MAGLKKAIQEFLEDRAKLYRDHPNQMIRDLGSVRSSIKDHAGRWFFELIQNSDDAKASTVEVHITDDAVYVCDDGSGFRPEAIESISGTHFSDKAVDTIGHKGVGFKAVYDTTETPHIYTVDDEGLVFSCREAQHWFEHNALEPPADGIPYEWIPTFVSRSSAQSNDAYLQGLDRFHTVVVLPFKSGKTPTRVLEHLQHWPAQALLPFNHVGLLRMHSQAEGHDFDFNITVQRSDACWTMTDSRSDEPTRWKVLRDTGIPSRAVLATIDRLDKKRASKITFLLAARLNQDSSVHPTESFLPLHVYYPTEQQCPVRLLIHAEFLVKSDRTAVVSLQSSEFNSWVADTLADLVVDFVNGSYDPSSPAVFLHLLVPSEDVDGEDDGSLTCQLWDRIRQAANERLQLPDTDGQPRLSIGNARLLSASTAPVAARSILEVSPLASGLVHPSLDDDNKAAKALRCLGCEELRDDDILEIIRQHAKEAIHEHEWIWACWRWLAAWLAKERWGDERKERIEAINELPIIPIGNQVETPVSLQYSIVTWQLDETSAHDLPDWLPLAFVENWFRDRINKVEDDNPVTELLSVLRISEPGEDVLIRATKKAISAYWQEPEGDRDHFLRFILTEAWEQSADLSDLSKCPIPVCIGNSKKTEWVPAEEAYFGSEWGEAQLARLYYGDETIPWVQRMWNPEEQYEQERRLLETLGVTPYPRLIRDKTESACQEEESRVTESIPRSTRHIEIQPPLVLDKVELKHLDAERVGCLIALLSENWESYYEAQRAFPQEYFFRTWYYSKVDALWWEQVLQQLVPPIEKNYASSSALSECWLPDKEARRNIGKLIPIIDLSVFGDDAQPVRQWLTETVGVRRSLNEICVEEWRQLLSDKIPGVIPAEEVAREPRMRDTVVGWYEACLHSLDEQVDMPERDIGEGALSDVPLLARKGELWAYHMSENVWLADDQEIADAFRDDLWQIELRSARRSEAKTHLELRLLSDAVEIQYLPGPHLEGMSEELQQALDQLCEDIFVWRCSQTKQDQDKLRDKLHSLRVVVVDHLDASLTLDEVSPKRLEKQWGIDENNLLISAEHWDSKLTALAYAVAEAVRTSGDADFYENLLRCGTDEERNAKLISKGITDAEIHRLRRRFNREAPPEPEFELSPKAVEDAGPQPQEPLQASTEVEPDATLSDSAGQRQGEKDTATVRQEDVEAETRPQLDLKNLEIAEVQLSSETHEPTQGRGPSRPSVPTMDLTQQQKDQIEQMARDAAQRKLDQKGYSVTPMSQYNPGYDLKATKDGHELRVEVKGHLGNPSTLTLTSTQYAHWKMQSSKDYEWELWNVANLSAKSDAPIQITCYNYIPPEAVSEQQLRLDLTKCKPISVD